MNAPTAVTLFSGGGLAALGARTAGFDLVGAVEYAEDIAGVYADNLGPCVTVGKVEDVNPLPYIGIDALLASPVCTRMSVANANRGETEVDRVAAEGVCRWLRVCRPKAFVMENVTQYRDSDSYRLIMATLYRLGYLCTDDTCNAADYGVPQTRRRMIVRALLGQMPPPLKPTHYNPLAASEDGGLFAEDTRGMTPWVGWYAAIEDILHTLPESKFADWQLKRLDPQLLNMASQKLGSFYADTTTPRETGITCRAASEPVPSITASAFRRNVNIPRALLIEGDAAGDRPPTCGTSAEPAFTLKTASGGRVHRAFLVNETSTMEVREAAGTAASQVAAPRNMNQKAWLEQGRVVAMTPRALARFMSVPDWYALPTKNSLAATVLGNGFCCFLSEVIMAQLHDYL